ncbi:ureidoglycolate hydrolase [Blyttiomyces helicus]|uniref:Ureidoglycolate hydrolase n=1 Tax=Blyttiomyces helicus TaxID=388810 RepID=A0A4P9WF78_9FUNG|nr:ureidoglycolate hydrolase [Blyttiomyces helicus]|eukprot:RKO89958.1 ureidoglycolate hydrolase [Blyttiomyces helicus]
MTSTRNTVLPPDTLLVISALPLTREAFAPYGDVVAPPDAAGSAANQGTAERHDFLGQVVNLRSPGHGLGNELVNPPAVPNLCIFRVTPTPVLPFPIRLLERHRYSNQLFIPMTPPTNGSRAYLVIVATSDSSQTRPDLSTLKAFIASSTQAINYGPGVWHHPMVGLERPTDFVCLVHERRGNMVLEDEDTEEVFFDRIVEVAVEGFAGVLV